jgi:outer membrane biosynthesis protein TonB
VVRYNLNPYTTVLRLDPGDKTPGFKMVSRVPADLVHKLRQISDDAPIELKDPKTGKSTTIPCVVWEHTVDTPEGPKVVQYAQRNVKVTPEPPPLKKEKPVKPEKPEEEPTEEPQAQEEPEEEQKQATPAASKPKKSPKAPEEPEEAPEEPEEAPEEPEEAAGEPGRSQQASMVWRVASRISRRRV